MYGKRRVSYRILMGRHEGRRPLGRPNNRWEDNIKMGLQEVGGRTWNRLIWLRIGKGAGFCECSNEPMSSIKCGEFLV
jgi:hypothetical protein